MKIESIRLKNFKAFKGTEMLDIPHFCVLVGANGSGKSTLFQVFAFLKEALASNVHTALIKLGGSKGFREVRSRNSSGNIEIEVKFRERGDKPLITYFLSPKLLWELAEEFRAYATRGFGSFFINRYKRFITDISDKQTPVTTINTREISLHWVKSI